MSERKRIEDQSEPYDDARNYDVPGHDCSDATRERALDAAETLLSLAAAGKLDATDLRIIEERSRSPMPSEGEVGAVIGISQQAVHKRIVKIRSIMTALLSAQARAMVVARCL